MLSPADKKKRDHIACDQWTVQKSVSLMVWSCISVYDVGSLHICKDTNAEEYIEDL